MKYVALVDCNSFYCSCEKIFRPDLRKRPVIVLSNNDGAAIAFTKEAREAGFGQMCEAYFKIKDRIKEHKVAVFSSNYAFYDDISKRVMSVLRDFSRVVEIYSVDEAFIELEVENESDLESLGKSIRSEVLRRVGMPVGVGISTTKVLAKAANKLSKNSGGVKVLTGPGDITEALSRFRVRDVWGIGHRSAMKLNMLGIKTALELRNFPDDKLIQKFLTKIGREIQDELRGISCLKHESIEDKKNTGNSRSFGYDVRTKRELQEALAQFATNAVVKLRGQNSVCYGISAFIHTNPFKPGPQYYGSAEIRFDSATSDVLKIIAAAHEILDKIFKPGFAYKKGGVLLSHIVPTGQAQVDLFCEDPSDNKNLNQVLDLINKKYGPHTVKSASCGVTQPWKTIHDYKSHHYTTSWNDLLQVEL